MDSTDPRRSVRLSIVTAQSELFRGEVDTVILPAQAGEICVLPGHTPLLARINPGEGRYRIGNEWTYLFLEGGFLEIQPHEVTVLADTAVRAEAIDAQAAAEAVKQAQKRESKAQLPYDQQLAQLELMRALAMLKVAEDMLRKHRR
ncbi:ATP synthase F1 subunit epsilon [Acidihalobacter ferrooxydans]|uniref:ATP synthase epsilon chain n=1 Tax=Acidihalobacter ferrooxydans TaxID=1765967 RepID=A0A1P8ULE6_9GAMM|nr:ATP synthase F1 subunit epsilon [Acidihalobacter ferrooxydans]APZ44655.1 ATP synthase F1 subunit epsilon [Acidihalobacter ferrooxydans]